VEIDGVKLDGTVYRCQHFNKGCQAKVWMIGDQYGKETTADHDHAADPFDVLSREVTQEAKHLLRSDPLASIRDVMAKALSGQPDSVLDYIDRENLRKVLFTYKKTLLNYPDGPTSPRALVIPEEWSRHPNGDPFVIYDRIVDDERIVVMSSPYMLEVRQ
jgi:hypothetical protein